MRSCSFFITNSSESPLVKFEFFEGAFDPEDLVHAFRFSRSDGLVDSLLFLPCEEGDVVAHLDLHLF
jgi:hypothetical protein